MNHSGNNYYKQFLHNLRLIVKCGICGHKQKIEFHHIKPTKLNGNSRGRNNRAKDIIKNPDCYIPLCFFCHKKVTSKEIEIYHDIGILKWYYPNNPTEQYVGEFRII